jgi:F420-non-reducing hydrogenase iron-sulfur subunit
MVEMTRELIKILGIEPARLRLEWVSSAEGGRFAEIATEFTEQIISLGPSALKQVA